MYHHVFDNVYLCVTPHSLKLWHLQQCIHCPHQLSHWRRRVRMRVRRRRVRGRRCLVVQVL